MPVYCIAPVSGSVTLGCGVVGLNGPIVPVFVSHPPAPGVIRNTGIVRVRAQIGGNTLLLSIDTYWKGSCHDNMLSNLFYVHIALKTLIFVTFKSERLEK